MERLIELHDRFGQSPWLDNLKRGYITSGQLADLRDRGIRGLTSNPTIFQKAISGSSDYDEQFRELAVDDGPVIDDYWALVLQDIVSACAVFDPVYESSDGGDGFVSVEVDPGLAHDSAGTEAAARDLHQRPGPLGPSGLGVGAHQLHRLLQEALGVGGGAKADGRRDRVHDGQPHRVVRAGRPRSRRRHRWFHVHRATRSDVGPPIVGAGSSGS